jgi:hypothetical protein
MCSMTAGCMPHYSPDVDGKLTARGREERIWEENNNVLSFDLFITCSSTFGPTTCNWRKA